MNTPDMHLLRRSLLGDRNAFGELVRAHQATVMSLVMGWIPRLEDAEEITQEVFIRAYRQLHTLRDPRTFLSWVRTMASRLCVQQMERERRIAGWEEGMGEVLDRGVLPGPEEVVAQRELRAYVEEAFSALPSEIRQVMTLRWFEGYTYREIAQEMGVSEGVVRGRLARGRAQLKEELADLAEEVFRDGRPRESFTRGVVAGLPGLGVGDWLRRMVALVRLSGLSVWSLVGVVGMVMVLLGGVSYRLWFSSEESEEGSSVLQHTLFHVQLAYMGLERFSAGVHGIGEGGRESLSTGETTTFPLPGDATMEMVWIGPGTFVMGSPENVPGKPSDEYPLHEVTITKGFWLGKYEITQEQWTSAMGTRPWSGKRHVQENASNPAVYISWYDIQAFITKLNEAEGGTVYRLPTEAEWEYACRAGTATRWSFGEDESQLKDYAWYDDNTWDAGEQYAHAVGTKLPNPWGLYDLHGNVWEWCQAWWSDKDGLKVLRGGAYVEPSPGVWSAYRTGGTADCRDYSDVGVRLLRMGASFMEVDIDIASGSDSSRILLQSKGAVPVAVLTTDDFSITTLDPETVVFAGTKPVRSTIEDVDGDGDEDLLFYFDTQDLDLTEESTEATLTGKTRDGMVIRGMDTVHMVPVGKAEKPVVSSVKPSTWGWIKRLLR